MEYGCLLVISFDYRYGHCAEVAGDGVVGAFADFELIVGGASLVGIGET
jgi:hypothetical protein